MSKFKTTGCGRMKRCAQFLAIAIGLNSALPAYADLNNNSAPDNTLLLTVEFIDDVGGNQRINFSGKLRMLSQRVVANACYVQAGIASEDSPAALQAAVDEFNLIMEALEVGNPDLGIFGPEERRKTLVGMEKLDELWIPVAELAQKVGSGQGTQDDVAWMAELSAPLLEMAVRLVAHLTGQYSNPTALLQSDAMLVDVAGRQRMLSQRMSKNTCLIAIGINVEAAQAELQVASTTFDASLDALYFGLPSSGIMPPPNAEIAQGLEVVRAKWADLQPVVDRAIAGEAINDEQLSIIFPGANAITGGMNTVVGMYSAASELGL